MSETLKFIIDSSEKFILDYMTYLYNKKPKNTDDEQLNYECWLRVFDNVDGEKRISQILSNLYPQGMSLNINELNKIFQESLNFIKQDKDAKRISVKLRKNHFNSYVYSMYNDCVEYAFQNHEKLILKHTENFFGKLYEYSKDDIFNFIMKNFKIVGSDKSLFEFATHVSELCGG